MRRRTWSIVTLVLGSLALGTPAWAGTIGLEWNPSAGASGYTVHWGPSVGNYTNSRDVGNTTSATLSGVDDCTHSYYAVTAYNSAGRSGYSNEVRTYPYAEVASITPNSTKQGTQFPLAFVGSNFDPSLEWRIEFEPDPCAGLPAGEVCPFRHDPNDTQVTCDRVEVFQTADPVSGDVRPAQAGNFTARLVAVGTADVFTRGFVVEVEPTRVNLETASSPLAAKRIDGGDLAVLGRNFGSCDADRFGSTQCGSGTFPFSTDLDGDGWIDGNDMVVMAPLWGLCWNGTTFTVAACAQ